jgi:hypothetical protein
MNTRLSPPALALAALFLLAGCAAGGSRDNPFSESADRREIKLSITNLDFNEATVYAITSGSRQRVGRVMGKKEEEFILPLYSTSDFYLEIDILAGPRCRTERVTVQPGDHLELTIQTNNPYLICWAG